jgi:alpha-mannosidase
MKKITVTSIGCGLLAFGILSLGVFAQEFKPRDYTVRLIGHAHIDLSWLWRWEETVHDVAYQTFRGTLAQMDKMPGLTFAQSQAAIYEAIEKNYPELFRAIREKIKAGTWVPVGGMWVEPDLNMPDGEALARQLLYGKKYFLDMFGVDVTVGWNPDSFGHSGQLPQILAKAGIRSYVFGRCAPDKTVAFTWQGKDGSKILSYVPQGWYNVSLNDGVRNVVQDGAKISPLKDFMILYGEGDHGGGPRKADLEAIEKFKKDKSQPRLEFITPDAYFKILERQAADLPLVQNELNFTFPACYTTQAETKKNNRKGESLLLAAEKFSSLAAASGFRDYYPERDIDEAWKIVLRNQFHDILDGSSIGPVYDETRGFYQEAFERGRRALDFSLETITDTIDTRGEGLPLVVYNPLLWERTDPVVCDIPKIPGGESFRILDSQGIGIPYQVIPLPERTGSAPLRVVFIAERIPSFGYALFRIVPADKAPDFPPVLTAGPDFLENEFFKVRVNPKTGWLDGLFDKANNREVLNGPGNVLQAIVDEPESMSAWELGLKETIANIGESGAKVELRESGPVRAVFRVTSPFRRSFFDLDIVLYQKIPRVDFRLRLNWQERKLMIKSAFPLNIRNEEAEFEIPFGSITRPADGREVPALRWIDISDASGSYGVSLLNDSRYGFDVKNSVARISVIHGATSPDPEADRGPHELVYALYPHRGTWKEAQTMRRGYELNSPLLPRIAMAHSGSGPVKRSFLSVDRENVILSTVKKVTGYAERDLIIRCYEAFGQKTEVNLALPWPVEAAETDLIERPLKTWNAPGNTVTFSLGPFEIKTIRLRRK